MNILLIQRQVGAAHGSVGKMFFIPKPNYTKQDYITIYKNKKPQFKTNFIFNENHYKAVFNPLKKTDKDSYNFMINLMTEGADIKRTERPPSKSHPNYPMNDET